MNTRTHLSVTDAVALALSAAASADPLPVVEAQLVAVAPPAPRREVVVLSSPPGPRHVWAAGSWDFRRGSWVWIAGRWARRPASDARWIPAEYVRAAGRWRYVPAHWSTQRVVVARGDGRSPTPWRKARARERSQG
jgi:hypothetical protein